MCRYDNQLRVEYLVQCEPDELAFFNMTHLNIQGPEDCQDEHENNRCNEITYKILSEFLQSIFSNLAVICYCLLMQGLETLLYTTLYVYNLSLFCCSTLWILHQKCSCCVPLQVSGLCSDFTWKIWYF